MIFKILKLPFWLVARLFGFIFGIIRFIVGFVGGTGKFIFSHFLGAIIGAIIGVFLGRKHVGVKLFTHKKKWFGKKKSK